MAMDLRMNELECDLLQLDHSQYMRFKYLFDLLPMKSWPPELKAMYESLKQEFEGIAPDVDSCRQLVAHYVKTCN